MKKALSQDTEARFQNAYEFLQALNGETEVEDIDKIKKVKSDDKYEKKIQSKTVKGKGFDAIAGMKELKAQLQLDVIDARVAAIVANLKALGISVKYDNSDNRRPGFKFADYELKGVPVRLVLGARDLENGTVEVMRRDTLEKETITLEGIEAYVKQLLDDIQANIFQKALAHLDSHITTVDTYDEFKEQIEKGGFILAHWDGTAETEALVKEETKATIRCVPFGYEKTPGKCMVTGKPSACRVLFARSY